MPTPTINLHRAGRPSQTGAQRNNDEQVWRPADRGEAREEGGWEPNSMQSSNQSRLRVLRGLVWLDDIVPLPQTLRGYLLFVLALTVVCGLAVFQVWTSLRITQARGELEALRVQFSLVEQRNAELLWQIGQRTTLEQVQTRAVQLDFRPALERNYIPSPYKASGAAVAAADSVASALDSKQAGRRDSLTVDQTRQRQGNRPSLRPAQRCPATAQRLPGLIRRSCRRRNAVPGCGRAVLWSCPNAPAAEFEAVCPAANTGQRRLAVCRQLERIRLLERPAHFYPGPV